MACGLALACAVCFSCASQPKVRTFVADDGVQQFFVRPVSVRFGSATVDFDCLIRTKEGAIIDPVTVNYSVTDKRNELSAAPVLQFNIASGTFPVDSRKVIYTSIENNMTRYSSTVDPASFTDIIRESESLTLTLLDGAQAVGTVSSNEVSGRFALLKKVIK